MADDADRLEAMEWMLAWVLAQLRTPESLAAELDETLPSQQYRIGPERNRLLPHFERVLQRALDLQKGAGDV